MLAFSAWAHAFAHFPLLLFFFFFFYFFFFFFSFFFSFFYRTVDMQVRVLMREWLPLAPCALSMVKRCLPSPLAAQPDKVDVMWPPSCIDAEDVRLALSSW